MHQTQIHAGRSAPFVVGGALVLVGLAAFASESVGLDVGEAIGRNGWPLFVIVPGLLLLLAAFTVTPPRGIGFAVAGSIVTTVGLILLYQNATGNYESWAYAWALIPTAAGLGLLGYGSLTGEHEAVRAGTRLAAIGGVLFLVGLWFFGSLFEIGRSPIDLGNLWPVLLIAGGALLVGSALFGGTEPAPTAPPPPAASPTQDGEPTDGGTSVQ